jgi:hypothetical protein
MTSRQNHRPSGEETTDRCHNAVGSVDPCEVMGQLGAAPTPTGAASTRGRRSIGLAPEPQHTHLDQQRRPRGVCPACDEAWARQDPLTRRHQFTEAVEARTHRRDVALGQLAAHRYGRPLT